MSPMNLRLSVLALGNFVIGTGALVIAGILPTVAGQLNVSITTAGQLLTIYAFTYAIASPFLAAFTSKMPRRPVLLGALLLFGGANLLAALAPNFELLFMARLLAAFGGALYTPTSSAVAITLAPPAERGRALALVFAGQAVSTVLGVPFGTFIGSNFGWRTSFVLVALLGLVGAGAIIVSLKDLAPATPMLLGQWLGLFKQKRLMIGLSVTFFQFTAQFTVFTYIAAILQRITGLDGTGTSIILFIFGIAGVVGNTFGGYAADRWNLERTLGLSIIILALSLFALPLVATSLVGITIALLVWCFVGFGFNPLQQSRILGLAPQTPGLVLSLNASMLYLGNGTGAALGGIVVSNLSLLALGWVGGIIALIAGGVLALSAASRKEAVPATPITKS